MPTKAKFISEVDALLRVEKELVLGQAVSWRKGRDDREMAIKLPLEIEGEQFGQQLVLTAFPLEAGKFSISLVHGVAVVRLDVTEFEGHTNPYDALGRRVPTLLVGPHLHSWSMNKRFVDSGGTLLLDLPMAEPYLGSRKLMAALRWFGGEHKIVIPHGPDIDLPPRGVLL